MTQVMLTQYDHSMVHKIRAGVVGAGQFGRHHCRVAAQSGRAQLVAVVDTDPARAAEIAARHGCLALGDYRELRGRVDAAIVAVPTSAHAEVGCGLLEAGIDVLVEKPITADLPAADRLIRAATAHGRILQVGHLERFNPAVMALESNARLPLFFEVHRLSEFSPRSLDVDVVLDLMIHDIDIVLRLVDAEPEEIRAAGISILTPTIDIANVRLEFPGGRVANLTASRVSTERVRKLRLFQPQQYVTVDYGRQDILIFTVDGNRRISCDQLPVAQAEPLQLQFEAFLDSVVTRSEPKTSGHQGRRALKIALAILDRIKVHSDLVSQALVSGWKL